MLVLQPEGTPDVSIIPWWSAMWYNAVSSRCFPLFSVLESCWITTVSLRQKIIRKHFHLQNDRMLPVKEIFYSQVALFNKADFK